ncbi:MAG: hypothetical protein IKD80_07415 [Selenomonadaceae bacterium]|nr:hypothetical protein [Selenomonadaceae bacterium]
MKNEMLTMNELDRVNGTSLTEVHELSRTLMKHDSNGFISKVGPVLSDISAFLQDTCKVGKIAGPINILLRNAVASSLSSKGIKTDLSVGILGTGMCDDPNRYEVNGQRISHAEVLKMI